MLSLQLVQLENKLGWYFKSQRFRSDYYHAFVK